jgi:RNA polymerase sigma-70 factor (ECF subfamily)
MGIRASKILPFPAAVSAEREEEGLIDRLTARDRGALTQVYRRYHQRVRAVARGMLGDEAAAEDVVHDTFVALPEAMSRFRGEAKLGTFLVSIAVNLCRRRRRSAARGEKAAERIRRGRVLERVPSPEQQTRRRRLAERLRRGLSTLSPELREAFTLCAVEERTSIEAAEILGVPPGTVRRRLFEARKSLREFLEEEELR